MNMPAFCQPGMLPNSIPPRTAPANESLAQTVARSFRESGELSRYNVNVMHHGNGWIDLTGEVADESQRQTAVRLARAVVGVQVVRDWLQVRAENGIVTAQGPLFQP